MLQRLKRFQAVLAPVLAQPVFIVESDDWGPGPEVQAKALEAICTLLKSFKDHLGHPPVMTIGVVLSIPDPEAIADTHKYHACFLDDPKYRPIVTALKAGEQAGVFDLQLHGLAHFWPEGLMVAWERDEAVRRWLAEDGWRTERLPAWLQSRWVDVRTLPSRPLPFSLIQAAVEEEVKCFQRCFGRSPKVVVPPTFVWDANVERAYAEAGIEVLITPGRRYLGRDREGRLAAPDRGVIFGESLPGRLTALVRDVYFEPALGHRPEAVLKAIERKWRRREPALLETHRFNFLDGQLPASLDALRALLEEVLRRFPSVCFTSSYRLATQMASYCTASPIQRIQAISSRIRS